MSIFSWFKNIFSKKTKWKNKDDEIIECFSNDGFVMLNAEISVAQNQNAIVVARNKVTDIFSCGEFMLSPATMPITNKRCKLSKGKIDKKTKQVVVPNKFEGFLLFINLDTIEQKVKSKRMIIKDEQVGRIAYRFLYNFSFVINSSATFAKHLLTLSMKIRDKNVKSYVCRVLNNELKKNLKKNKLTLEDIVMPDEKLDEKLSLLMRDSLSKLGVTINNFDVQDVLMSKRTNRRIAERVDEGAFEIGYKTSQGQFGESGYNQTQNDTSYVFNDNTLIDFDGEKENAVSDFQNQQNIYKLPDLTTILGEDSDNTSANTICLHDKCEDNIYNTYTNNNAFEKDEMCELNNYNPGNQDQDNCKSDYCINCGIQLFEGVVFCYKCGYKQTNLKECQELDDRT